MISRPDRKTLSLYDAWLNWRPKTTNGNVDILIGLRENDNEPLILSPYPQPHTLVAGTTGSGKSVLIQNVILGIAVTNSPEQAELVIIDPKQGLDYLGFERLPHLSSSIVRACPNSGDGNGDGAWRGVSGGAKVLGNGHGAEKCAL